MEGIVGVIVRLGALVLVTVVFYETAKVALTKGYIHAIKNSNQIETTLFGLDRRRTLEKP